MTELTDLSPEQREVVEDWGRGLAVLAGAGSGKTTTLTIKCAELLKRNPEARFAAVSFTERSASDLRAKLTDRLTRLTEQGVLPHGQAGVLSRHWVTTIHGLCQTILREFPAAAGFDGEETMLSEPESGALWSRALEGLWLDDGLPEDVERALDLLLSRESRDSVGTLLRRVRELESHGVLPHLEASEDAASRALAVCSRHVLARYDRLKRRRGALDFNDLERGADRVLEDDSIREQLRKRFDLVLVDEFQDTNPVQARILTRLVREDFSNLCVVGDPKQSIYRFRDADVSLFEEFCSRLPALKTLSWNFRSRPGIIDYANHVCAQAFDASGMRYDALIPKREAGDYEPVVRLDASGPAAFAAWVAAETRERGVALHDMALLLRKIRGNEKWLKALTAAGIPIAVGSGGLFWSDPRVRELTAFLSWWDNPAHTLGGAVFLRTPWMRVEDKVLDEWSQRDRGFVTPFFASDHPVARVLAPLRGKIVRPGELLMALLAADGAEWRGAPLELERELGAPLLGLWHRAEELSSRGLDFHAVVGELADCCREERRERDVPPPRNHGQLSVLTLHGSKGLEFPHVILLDLGKKGRAQDAPLLFWDRERGAYLGGRDSDGERDKKNPYEVAWRETEKAKNLAESKRLFYVALTRAQERLVLVCPELEGHEIKPAELAYSEDDWRAWVDAAGMDVPRAAPERETSVAWALEPPVREGLARLPAPQLTRPRHSVTEWVQLARCERAYEWRHVRPVVVEEEGSLFAGASASPEIAAPAPTVGDPELTQRELGTMVHECLENRDFERLRALGARVGQDRLDAESLIAWAQSSEVMQGEQVWSELAFEVPVPLGDGRPPAVLVGSIDRLVRSEQGEYTIVDFKVVATRSGRARAPEELAESYQAQLDLYALGLERLEPSARGRMRAALVAISGEAPVEVPLEVDVSRVAGLAEKATQIVAGRAGRPEPGRQCRYCEFKPQCPEGKQRSARA